MADLTIYEFSTQFNNEIMVARLYDNLVHKALVSDVVNRHWDKAAGEFSGKKWKIGVSDIRTDPVSGNKTMFAMQFGNTFSNALVYTAHVSFPYTTIADGAIASHGTITVQVGLPMRPDANGGMLDDSALTKQLAEEIFIEYSQTIKEFGIERKYK